MMPDEPNAVMVYAELVAITNPPGLRPLST